jgi:hypothetical protein
MHKTKKLYKAFGLVIESELPIPSLQTLEAGTPDVRIVPAKLRGVVDTQGPRTGERSNIILTLSDTLFRVTNGNLIEADVAEGDTEGNAAMYLMGSCMGAILVQRGFMLLHGSCVTDGKRSILITGDSGAGKSTLAAEFLKRGWKLLTDDVTCVFDREGVPMVRSSYPSQKLWQDALDRYEKSGDDIHSLYFSEDREKFGVNVAGSFFDGTAPLSMAVRLIPADHPTCLSPIEGMARVDQLMRNTYRMYLIEKRHLQRHFQRCVTLATKLPMALAVRENGKDCAPILYDMITKFMEEHCHD